MTLLDRLQAALETSWCAATSRNPDKWTPENPAYGQCFVSALVVNDYLGGALMKCKVGKTSHYYNVTGENSVGVDTTIAQFRGKRRGITDHKRRERTERYRLDGKNISPESAVRYALLAHKVSRLMEHAG